MYVISDLHFGHESCAKRRGFGSIDDHDETIIERWNSVVNKRDTVWILGDLTMEKTIHYPLLNRLKGIKNVVLGNHDLPQHVPELQKYVNKIAGAVDMKGCLLTHVPIHTTELYRYKCNIHGHVHTQSIANPRYYNVCAEVLDYYPIAFSEILGI